MDERDRFLAADDAELLGQCEAHTYVAFRGKRWQEPP